LKKRKKDVIMNVLALMRIRAETVRRRWKNESVL